MAYSENQLAQLWVKAGGPAKVADLMAKIALRESGGRAGVDNSHNGPGGRPLNRNGTVDTGLWAINSVHGYNPQKLRDPIYNAKAAVAVYKSQGLNAWSTYNPQIDAKYIGRGAQQASAARSPQTYGTSAPQPQTVAPATSDPKRQIALSLLGMGGLAGYGTVPPPTPQPTVPKAAPTKVQVTPSAPAGTHSAMSFDGKPVVSWMVPILKQARETGIWKGSVTSGERTKAQQLSAASHYGLQHYPNGPLASNHVIGHDGAVDVSDPQGLKRALAKLGVTKLKSSMPEDPVHFSRTGY